jgi:hypothetical protein
MPTQARQIQPSPAQVWCLWIIESGGGAHGFPSLSDGRDWVEREHGAAPQGNFAVLGHTHAVRVASAVSHAVSMESVIFSRGWPLLVQLFSPTNHLHDEARQGKPRHRGENVGGLK